MGTNEGWPESFGFSLAGGVPVVVARVEEGGSAQQAGLQAGDLLVRLDGVDVQQCSLEQVRMCVCIYSEPAYLLESYNSLLFSRRPNLVLL